MTSLPVIHSKEFDALTVHELYEILQARSEVFVVEQNCVYQDLDFMDQKARHVCLYSDSHLAAYCRVLPAGLKYDEWSIGRVLTTEAGRGKGLGHQLMVAALQAISQNGGGAVRISAQLYLQKFYEGYGFEVIGESYLEDNIPHIGMVRV